MSKAHEGMAVAELPGAYTSGTGTDAATDANLQPMETGSPKRTKTIVDLLGNIFGGGDGN